MMKVTQWFGPETTPIYSGVYQKRTPGNGKIFYCYWYDSSQHWGQNYTTVLEAYNSVNNRSRSQRVTWRGISAQLDNKGLLTIPSSGYKGC